MKSKYNYNRLKSVLVEKNITSKELAKVLSRSETTVSRWCTNDVQPSIPTLYEIADYLNVNPTEILNTEHE